MDIRWLTPLIILLSMISTGCSNQSELDAAKNRIAQLEAELVAAKAKTIASPAPGSPPSTASANTTRVPKPEPKVEPTGKQWEYDEREDKMSGGTIRHASVPSTNLVNFSSPYSGPQNGRLVLRIDPRQGRDVIFSIERGQLLCRSYQDCEVLIRFDDGKPERFSAVGPADNSTETLFIRNYDKFMGKLQKSKMVRLSVNIYQEGSPVFEFDVNGLNLSRLTTKKN